MPPVLTIAPTTRILPRRRRRRIVHHINATLPIRPPLLPIDALQVPVIDAQRIRLILGIQVELEDAQILGIALEGGVGEVADKGDEADEEIDGDVEEHADQQRGAQAAGDGVGFLDEEEGEGGADGVAGEGDQADDGFPAEAEAEEAEEGAV
jgi:hypothetical protein